MAILKAISGGNYWNTAAKWQYYDENTDSWNAYNNYPQNGDYVYLNGYTIGIGTNSIEIGSGTITNEGNTSLGVSAGGSLILTHFTGRNITANIKVKDIPIFRFESGSNYIWTFIGNIDVFGNTPFANGGIASNNSIIISGNISFENNTFLNLTTAISRLEITGNVNSGGGMLYGVTQTVTINGNVTNLPLNSTTTINGSYTLNEYDTNSNITITINGDLNLFNGHCLSCTTLNFYGNSIKYSGWATDSIGNLKVKNLNIGNLTNFIWHDVSVVRTAPFFIVSDYDLSNTDQYPTPTNVKKDVPYAWGELVGQYLPDYPPETVVVKGYVYDSGEMVGTYEGGGTVQNTINVYPYKKRNDY